MSTDAEATSPQLPTLTEAIIPVASRIALVTGWYWYFGDAGASGPNEVAPALGTCGTPTSALISWISCGAYAVPATVAPEHARSDAP